MKCPCCGEEMEKGYMQGASGMTWTQDLHNLMLAFPKENEVMFTSGGNAHCCCTAYICKECQKIIMDYSDGVAVIK